jgi:hypothetical protein
MENAPPSLPDLYDWLEEKLGTELKRQLQCRVMLQESQRTGETISVRFALWDLDLSRLDSLRLQSWKILELALHTEIYGEFISRE